MKRFLIYVLLFSIPVILTLAIGEIIVRQIPNSYAAKNAYAKNHGDEIKTLILGSSHTYFGVVADSLGPDVLNLANISQNFEYDYRLLTHYAEDMPNLSRIILPVSYFSFIDPPFEGGAGKWSEIYYKVYMGIDKYPDISRYSMELSNLPVYTGKLKSLLPLKKEANRRAQSSPQGFGLDYALSQRYPDWKETAEEHAGYHTAENFDMVNYNLQWFDSIFSYCENRNIKIQLITTPVWVKYRELLDTRQLEMTYNLTDSVAKRYGVSYSDFSADPRFTEDDFYDADHLSDHGAFKFTRILRDSLLNTASLERGRCGSSQSAAAGF